MAQDHPPLCPGTEEADSDMRERVWRIDPMADTAMIAPSTCICQVCKYEIEMGTLIPILNNNHYCVQHDGPTRFIAIQNEYDRFAEGQSKVTAFIHCRACNAILHKQPFLTKDGEVYLSAEQILGVILEHRDVCPCEMAPEAKGESDGNSLRS
jgi:hypothetical protein